MNHTSRLTELRRLQLNAEHMARLSPFKADREKFGSRSVTGRKPRF